MIPSHEAARRELAILDLALAVYYGQPARTERRKVLNPHTGKVNEDVLADVLVDIARAGAL